MIRPPEAIPQVAIDTPKRRGTSRFTKRLFTRSGITAALAPSTTSTLKIFEPTILLTAIASPALPPLSVESRLTNSSGALVPKDTTVRPITIWGIPNSNESATEPATNNSPPQNNNKMPIIIKPKSIKKGGVIRFNNNFELLLERCSAQPLHCIITETKPARQHLHPRRESLAKQLAVTGICAIARGKAQHIFTA